MQSPIAGLTGGLAGGDWEAGGGGHDWTTAQEGHSEIKS